MRAAFLGLIAVLALLVSFAGVSADSAAAFAKGPYLQNATGDGITVCWVSDRETRGTVRCYRNRTWPFGGRTLTARDGAPARFHKLRLTGLLPHRRYHYQVTCDGAIREGSFRSAAKPDQPYRFAVYGDNRTQPNVHAQVLASIGKFQPDFVVHTGDLVANGQIEPQWTEFFHVAGDVLSCVPYFPSLGNHERDGAAYLRYFNVDRDYSFDYGNAHFAALDSNRSAAQQAAQVEWLSQDLASHQDAVWRIVFFHHTIYTCVVNTGRRELSEILRARLEPVFLKAHVQVVLNGHDHDYQHHFAKGIHYVVSGGGGAPLYNVNPNTPFVRVARKAHHFCEISVRGGEMAIRAVEPDGNVIESFKIEAKGPGENRGG